MAFYSISSGTYDIENDKKTIDMTRLCELEPYINGITKPYALSDPYSLLLSVVDHSYSEYIYRFTLFTPDYVLYITFTDEEFQQLSFDDSVQPNTFRLIYVLSGTLYQEVEGERQCYGKNDACFLSPQILHTIEYKTDFTAVTVSYSRKYFQTAVAGDPSKFLNVLLYRDYTKFYIQTEDKEQGFTRNIPWYFWNIFEGLLFPIPSNTAIIGVYLYRPLASLENFSEYSVVPVRLKKATNKILFERISELMRETHGRITRKQLADELRYSGDYLNKIVKRHTGMNISQYSNTFTMEHSCWLLTNTTKSVSDICSELLFTNRTLFYKLFKEFYGMTPKEYREKKSGEETEKDGTNLNSTRFDS